MRYRATIVELPDVQLAVCRAEEFPGDIKGAWDRLESRLSSLRGRKFYGLTVCEGSQLAYFAGVVPVSNQEVSSLGLPKMMIKGGKYARAKLFDWSDHTDEIGKVFDELMRDFTMDPSGPSVEYYRSQSELHLLIPLTQPEALPQRASRI